ncbi:uncharacterized protein LOC111628392 [Centruroides sculpturatus]|uniref:uncharacterized protein LOC111628392 n=1 Tax=Centruroides sculpturatus TaxID=218467 RepID=UPI000C6D48C3|nr:uncharacterized protein LOC111628392 [Centruroides sculpturatus]
MNKFLFTIIIVGVVFLESSEARHKKTGQSDQSRLVDLLFWWLFNVDEDSKPIKMPVDTDVDTDLGLGSDLSEERDQLDSVKGRADTTIFTGFPGRAFNKENIRKSRKQ